MSAAFVYRIDRDPEQLDKIKEMLQASLDYYHASYEQDHCVNWYSTSRVSWLAALDWVWNDLTEQEPTAFGLSILDYLDEVHDKPDHHFVVFDRVTSTDASYGKRWLLHHAQQPVVVGDIGHGDQVQGRLFCRTLLPADAQLQAVGGPDRSSSPTASTTPSAAIPTTSPT